MASAEALLEVLSAEEEEADETRRLEKLGIHQTTGDPQESYEAATKLFRRAQSFYESHPSFPAVTKD